MNIYRYLLIPDVHGRDFWKDPVKTTLGDTDAHIVFMGDYLDPYGYEGVTEEQAIEGFVEIINLKKHNPDRITLLLGNHDLHYVENHRDGCRMDYRHKAQIVNLFKDNIDLFDMFYIASCNDKRYIISHAGFTKGWINYRIEYIDFDAASLKSTHADIFDAIDIDYIGSIDWKHMLLCYESAPKCGLLSDVSYHRGGGDPFSSFLWCDLGEMLLSDNIIPNQIFGHSQQEYYPVNYNDTLYCLDCRRAFVIDEQGFVRYYDTMDVLDNNGESIKWAYERREEQLAKMAGFFF